eukprot:COSAG05_NODE_1362_length_5087_cov_50.062550_4_plen_87_part_00
MAKESLCELCGMRLPSANILGHQGTELCRSMAEMNVTNGRRRRTQTQRLHADHHTFAQQCKAAEMALSSVIMHDLYFYSTDLIFFF